MLAPFANFFAFGKRDPAVIQQVRQRLQLSGKFSEIFSPHPHWIVAVAPLAETESDPPALRQRGLVFAEGRDQVQYHLPRQVGQRDLFTTAEVKLLPGDFTFVQFDDHGSALAVRSAAGPVPLYCCADNDGVMLTTLATFAFLFHPKELELDTVTLSCWLSNLIPHLKTRSLLEGVAALAPGTTLRVHPDSQPVLGRYWSPPPMEPLRRSSLAAQKQEFATEIRRHLLHNLERLTNPAGGNLLRLSAGIDSGALAALMTRCLGFKYRAVHYEARGVKAGELNEYYLRRLESELGINATRLPRPAPQEELQSTRFAPNCLAMPLQYRIARLAELRPGSDTRIVITGDYADHLFADQSQRRDWFLVEPPWAVARHYHSPLGKARALRKWLGHQGRRLSQRPKLPAFNPLLDQAYSQSLVRALTSGLPEQQAPRGVRPYLYGRVQQSAIMAANWELTYTGSLRYVHPFFSRSILEVAFRSHPLLHLPGPKELLHTGLSGDVPSLTLKRADKGRDDSVYAAALRLSRDIPAPLRVMLQPSVTSDSRFDYFSAFMLEATATTVERRWQLALNRSPLNP